MIEIDFTLLLLGTFGDVICGILRRAFSFRNSYTGKLISGFLQEIDLSLNLLMFLRFESKD